MGDDNIHEPQLLMPVFTEALKAEARVESPSWDASDDISYDLMIMLSGKDVDDVMPALMSMVATNLALIAPDLASAVRGAEVWGEGLVELVKGKVDFVQRLNGHKAAAGRA